MPGSKNDPKSRTSSTNDYDVNKSNKHAKHNQVSPISSKANSMFRMSADMQVTFSGDKNAKPVDSVVSEPNLQSQ